MLDLFLLGFIGLVLVLGLKRPFFWVLLYIYIDIVAPQKVGWGLVTSVPVSLIAFLAAFGGWIALDRKEGSRFAFRQVLIGVLLVYCYWTTMRADFPVEALVKWEWVWKSLLFGMFLPLALRTKLRIEAAVLVVVLSLGTIVINGGIKTILGGGGYGTLALLAPGDNGLYESSILSASAISLIPLSLFLARHGTIFRPDWRVTVFAAGVIFASLLIPVGLAARTGLVCAAVVGLMIWRSSRHKLLFAGLAAIGLVVAVPFLPKSYLDRMGTIANHEGDSSASTRVQVWLWTLDYVKQKPLGGGFDAYRSNSFTYYTRAVEGPPGNPQVKFKKVTDKARAYHNSYFEMLGEQGWPGLILFLWLHLLGLWQMERIRWRFRREQKANRGQGGDWRWGLATSLQQAHVSYLVGSLFVGIAFQPYAFILVGLQIALWSYIRRTESPPQRARFTRPPEAGEPAVSVS
ncbi:putative O-glycosylation ligase, exosortase A system-associated [Tsuneonella sp. HG222]